MGERENVGKVWQQCMGQGAVTPRPSKHQHRFIPGLRKNSAKKEPAVPEMALKPRAPHPEEKYVSVLTTSQLEEFGLRPHSSNGLHGDHNGDLELEEEEEEEEVTSYLEDGRPPPARKAASLSDRLSSAKASLLNFRLPTASEIKNNYINSNFHRSLNQPLMVKSRVEQPEVQKTRQVITQSKGPAELSQIHGLADLPLPKINLLEANHHHNGPEEAKEDHNEGGSILNLHNFTPMNTLPRSLREQNIQTACKETPADDEELTKRMELTKTMTPSQLSEIHSLADFPVPTRIKQLFDKTAAVAAAKEPTDGSKADEAEEEEAPVGGLYGTLPRSLRETKLITKLKVEEDEDVLAARRALVAAKSPLELSAITSLSDLPIPSTLERMVKRGKGAASSAPGSRLDVRSLSIKEMNIRNFIPESMKMELAVATKVETNQEQLDQRRRLVQEKTVNELAHIGSLADLPIPSPLRNLWAGEAVASESRRGSKTSAREKRLRNLTVGAIFSPESPFLPESMKETKLVVRSKVEVDPAVLAARQQLVKTSTPAELGRINGLADLPVPARLKNLHLPKLTKDISITANGEGASTAGSRPSSPYGHLNGGGGGGGSLYNSLPRSLRDQQLIVRCRTDDADSEDLKRRQELTRTMTPAQLSEISGISDLPIPAKLESLIKTVSQHDASNGDSPSAPPRQKWKKEDIYDSLPSSLKSELIVRSRNIVDEEELKQRQELIRSHTPSQLSEIKSLKDFPVPKFIEQHLPKASDDAKAEEKEAEAKEPFSIYESIVPASLKTNLMVKTVTEEPHIQAERAEAVKAKSVNELSQIHSLSDLPVPSTLLNLAKKGYAPVQRKKKFKEQMSELKSQSTQSLAQSIQSSLHATLPRSLSEKQLLVRARVEQPDVLAARRALVESKCVSELSQLASFHDLPVPTPLSKFFHKSMEKLDSLATSFKSFSTNDLTSRGGGGVESEEEGGQRPVSRFSLHSDLYASLPRSLKEQVLVRTKVEEDEEVLRQRQSLVQSKSPAQLSQIHSVHDLPVPARLEAWLHQIDSLKSQASVTGSQANIFAGNWHLSEALYRTLPASLSQPCVVRSKVEDPDLLLERQQLQQTKSIHELSKIRNLNEIPVPGDLIRLPDYPLPKLKNIMQTIARTPQRFPKRPVVAAWHNNDSCPPTPDSQAAGGADSTSHDATSKLYSEISELEDDRRALEREAAAPAAATPDDRLLDHDVDYEVIMKPKIVETSASPDVNNESFDAFDLAAQVKGTPERNIRNKINKKASLGNRRSRDTDDENRPASRGAANQAAEVMAAEEEDERPPPLPPKRATPSPKKGMSVESQASTEEEEYPLRPLKASLQLKVGIQSMPLPPPPAPPRTLKKKGSQEAAGGTVPYDEDDYTVYTEQFKTAADTFNTSKTLVEISSITQKVDEDLTLADSIVDNMVSCAETLVSDHDETLADDDEDNPYPSVYFETDRRQQQQNDSSNGSLKRGGAGRRLEEGTQQLSMELMEHVESLRSTLDNMSSRLGTRSRSRSASRSRSRPRSAYEK